MTPENNKEWKVEIRVNRKTKVLHLRAHLNSEIVSWETQVGGTSQRRRKLIGITSPPGCLWKSWTNRCFNCIFPRVPMPLFFFVLFGYLPDPPICHASLSLLCFSSCPLLSDVSQAPPGCSLVGTILEITPWTPDRHSTLTPSRSLNGTDAQSWARRRVKDGVGSAASQLSHALGPLPHHNCQKGKLNGAPYPTPLPGMEVPSPFP